MYDIERNEIKVNVKGFASSTFTHASLNVSVVTQADTGPAAKDLARPTIAKIREVIARHAEAAKVDSERLRASFSVQPDVRYSGGESSMRGYKASYAVRFECRDVTASLALHDELTGVAGITAETPVFHMANEGKVFDDAFADAAKKAKAKFESQCKAVGRDPDSFQISSWYVSDEIPRGKTLSVGANARTTEADVEPGRAVLELTVTFLFTHR